MVGGNLPLRTCMSIMDRHSHENSPRAAPARTGSRTLVTNLNWPGAVTLGENDNQSEKTKKKMCG